VPVFFSHYQYREAVPFGSAVVCSPDIVLVTGIARSETLVQHLTRQGFRIIRHFNFQDHHTYTQQDIQEISNFAASAGQVSLLTTQKDWTKLLDPALRGQVRSLPFFYLPIRVAFVWDQDAFDALILQVVGGSSYELLDG
jgi:tetraacyldisaccharide 4'-kinase